MRVFGRTAGAQTTTPDNLYFGPILRTLSAYVGSGVSRNSGVDESGTSARPRGHQDLFSSSGQTLFCLGLHPAIRRVALYFLGYSGYGPALSVLAGAAVRRMVEAADENKRSDEDGARGPTSFFELVAPDVDAMAVASANRVVGRSIKQVEGQLQTADVTTAGMKISWRFPLGRLPPEPEKLKEVICPSRKGQNGIDDPDFHHESHDVDGAAGDSLDVLVFDPPPGVAMTVYRNVFAECTPRLVFFENFGWQYQPYSGIVLRGVEEDKQKDQQTKKSWHSFISASDPYFGFQSHLYNQKTKDDYHAHGLENFNLLAVAGRTGAKQRVEAAVTVAATVFEKETGVDGTTEANTTIQPSMDAKTLTMSMLKKRVTSVRRGKEETPKQWMRRITHLHLEELEITRLGESFSAQLPNLKVLYAYDNQLQRVDVLPVKLELLYLQNNDLYTFRWSKIFLSKNQLAAQAEQLQEVSSLRTLNLANNKLEEFHLSADDLGEVAANHLSWLSLKHNPFLKSLTLSGVAHSLEVLDVTHCRLQNLAALWGMRMLKSLACEHNELHSLHEVGVKSVSLSIHPNPCTVADKKYAEPLILSAPNLEKIDARDVSATERRFLLELWKRKHERAQAAEAGAGAGGEKSGGEDLAFAGAGGAQSSGGTDHLIGLR
eukprot:g16662.t1